MEGNRAMLEDRRALRLPTLPDGIAESRPVARHLAGLGAIALRRRYPPGQVVFHQGDSASAAYVLLSGSVRVVLQSEFGPALSVALLGPGDCLGELAVIEGQPHDATAIADEPAELLVIAGEAFLQFLHSHPDAAIEVAASLGQRLAQTTELLADIAFLGLLPRLAKRLCQLACIGQGRLPIHSNVRIAQEDLAMMVGATREAVNKHLARLGRLGVIRTRRGSITIVKPEHLRAIALGKVCKNTEGKGGTYAGVSATARQQVRSSVQ